MRRTDGSLDFLETKFNRRCDGWSIHFQTPYNEPEDSKVNTCRGAIYELKTDSFWCSDKNWKSRSVEGTKKKPIMPTKIVNNPSYGMVENRNKLKKIPKSTRMKIQAHPGLPPMPFMFSIAAESKPEKALDNWVRLRGKKLTQQFTTYRSCRRKQGNSR